ncbi:CxC2 domain-containing protein [Mycena chlorophos]|uniref:CxC2 domain-containing protein n=1 Tax=Mycena chlorophos TaxID=658473 RepID=A0A8H6TPD5_MYCCL|nr:CxC2 domain-containing protein [Mycena chlorophos]
MPPRLDASSVHLDDDLYQVDFEDGFEPDTAKEPRKKVVRPSPIGPRPVATSTFASCSGTKVEGIPTAKHAPSVPFLAARLVIAATTAVASFLFVETAALLLTAGFRFIPFGCKWGNGFFAKVPLKTLGLRMQLGHAHSPQPCPSPTPACAKFVVLHTNGIHEVALDYCGCEKREAQHLQLLRSRLFPATVRRPQTCATFTCLDRFQLASVQAGMTGQNFYTVLELLTNAAGFKPPDRYRAFLRMAREYRMLLMLKRAGVFGLKDNEVADVKPGQLAIRCPACPRPDVNLPADWMNAPPENACIYTQFTATDACFALKRRMVSSELRDPALSSGWSYMVESAPYRAYLRSATNDQEMSTCSGLAALEHANTKFSKGWCKKLFERLAKLPVLVRIALLHKMIRFVVPKLHILGHTADCKAKFNLNYVPGSGQTDAEGIERAWAGAARMAASTKQMGPGARSDLLDDYWSFWNWRKLLGLPSLLRRRLENAEIERDRQLDAFESFSKQQEASTSQWRQMVLDHEADGSKKNPYLSEVKGMSEAQARLKVREEEEKDARLNRPVRRHEVGPVAFIEFGLALEELQQQAALKKSQSTAEQINLGSLRKRFNGEQERFRALQAVYTPEALVQLSALDLPQDIQAEKVPLLLPSALVASWRSGLAGALDELEPLQQQLLSIEGKLRRGQCSTALTQLRNYLHLKYHLLLFKKNHLRHQAMTTRSRATIATNESHILFQSQKYQTSWLALLQIENGDLDAVGFRRLKKKDIRCLKDAEVFSRKEQKRRERIQRQLQKRQRLQEEGDLLEPESMDEDGEDEDDDEDDEEDELFVEGSNKKVISWIWQGTHAGSNAQMGEAIRIAWCEAFTLSRRWDEEVQIVQEETRRVPVSLKYAEGMVAYCLKSGALYLSLVAAAEKTATEEKVARGQRRRRQVFVDDPLRLAELDPEREGETDTDDENLAERGDLNSEDEWDAAK